ncbi:alpha/beta hydrolase family protein [Rhizobium tumorigenes]|uniref:alpha/beta hydrolase family protein n=1 Tax=Rhizobium tumorigenes TaxID=2041385 RepID=UPI003BF9EB19
MGTFYQVVVGGTGAERGPRAANKGDPRTEEGRALLAERSPIHKVDSVTKPMLIFHGANDVRCKVAQSDTIVEAMQESDPGLVRGASPPRTEDLPATHSRAND